MNFIPASRDILKDLLAKGEKSFVYRTRDMIPFEVTGLGEGVFIIKDRHGIESTRQFSGFWLIKI